MPPSLANAFAALDLLEEASGGGGASAAKKKRNNKKKKSSGANANGAAAPAADDAGADEEPEEEEAAPVAQAYSSAHASAGAEPLADPLVWIDLEMTGLEVDSCAIIEIACLVTDGALERVIEGPNLVIHQSDEVLHGMNAWCVEQHGKSGLTQRVRASDVSLAAAEDAVLAFVERHTTAGTAPIAGNTVHCDLLFLRRYMPRLAAHLHYRIVDVSSIHELAKRWYPAELRRQPRKTNAHTAMSDVRESLAELRWLRKHVFKPSTLF